MGIYVERDPKAEIQSKLFSPHYTDKRFEIARSVFIAEGYPFSDNTFEGVTYVSNEDLIQTFGLDYVTKMWQLTQESGQHPHTAAFKQAHLCRLLEKSVTLVHIITGYDKRTGQVYRSYGYVEAE